MKNILNLFFYRSKATIFLLFGILIFGSYSYLNIAKEMNPDIKIPYLFVASNLRGVSPADGERLLLKPLESVLKSVEGLKNLSAFAVDGSAHIILEFEPGFDSEKAKNSVRTKLDQVTSELPADATTPVVTEINLSTLPVINIGIVGDVPYGTLMNISNRLKEKIEGVNGVLEVGVSGKRREITEVIIKPSDIQAYGLSTYEVAQAIAKSNVFISSGKISKKTGEYTLMIPGAIESVKDVASIPIRSDKGSIVTVQDISTVNMTYSDPTSLAEMNGRNCIVLEVSKKVGSNLLDTINSVKSLVEGAKEMLPNTIDFIYSQDQSDEIEDMLLELQNSVILAALLVIAVALFLMDKNSAIIIFFAIPVSFLVGILGIYLLGYTFNIVVLFSLIMSIGMLVDDTIVVVECADRKMSTGMSVKEAYYASSRDMFWPVITSTLTKIAVFLPLLFWPGTAGEFMKYMPITVELLLLSSLSVSLLFVPVIASCLNLTADKRSQANIEKIKAVEDFNVQKLSAFFQRYVSLLEYVLAHPKKIILITSFVLFSGSFAFFKFGPGMTFFPKVDSSQISISVRARGNLSLIEKKNILSEIESRISDMKEIKVLYLKAGEMNGKGNEVADNIGRLRVELVNWKKRGKSYSVIVEMRKKIGVIPGVIVDVSEERTGPSSGSDIQLDLVSDDSVILKKAAEKLVQFMQNNDGFKDPASTASTSQIQFSVKINREKAAMLGVDIYSIGVVAQMVSGGALMGKYRVPFVDDEIDILARFPQEDRTLKFLKNTFVTSGNGKSFPMSEFISVVPEQRVKKISRAHGGRVVSVTANVDRNHIVSERLQFLRESIGKDFPKDVNVIVKGESESSKESSQFLLSAFVISVFLMISVLIYEFNSFTRVFIVISAVFLSTTCVFLGLFLINYPLGIVMGGVGVISLAGIIVNNNILLVDAYQHNVEKYSVREAIIRSAVSRLRAILVTAVSTGIGLIPMIAKIGIDFFNFNIFHDSPSSQYWFDLSVTVVGGLAFATLLTLFFTPALLSVMEKK